MAVLNYRDYDRMPVVHFGYWIETLQKWHKEGHLNEDEAKYWADANDYDIDIAKKLGFDFGWAPVMGLNTTLKPGFPVEIIKDLGNGKTHVRNADGVIVLRSEGTISIPSEIDHTLKDRRSWEEHYKPRLQYTADRLSKQSFDACRERIEDFRLDCPLGINIGSLFGYIRNWMGMEAVSILYYEDEELYTEIIDTLGDLAYNATKDAMEAMETMETMEGSNLTFDYAHFWEDICFKNGPLVVPSVFKATVGPHYKRITDLLGTYGITIVSLDCDGVIDTLVPIWLENGVNTMFPIEVGTWDAEITPWREKYGKELRGVGGMNKNVFSRDKAAVDTEVERLKKLTALGGFIPCPDHRIAPDAKWELVQYYTDSMRKAFGG